MVLLEFILKYFRCVPKYWSIFHKDFNIGVDSLFILGLVEDIGEAALAAILAIEHGSHEDAGTTLLGGTLAPQTVDLAVVVDLVVLQHRELDLPLLVLDLLGGGVVLLLALLAAAAQAEDQVQGGLCNHVGKEHDLTSQFWASFVSTEAMLPTK